MDTAEYNRYSPAIRGVVNSLLEPNIRTNLTRLIIDYIPKKGHREINRFFEGFSMCWNTLIRHTIDFLSEFQRNSARIADPSFELYTFYPDPLKIVIDRMKEVINSTGGLPGDSRANIIELQLAYALRKLEMDMQPGFGIGHGLVGIFEINKG